MKCSHHECLKHLECVLGLIHWDHVSSVVDAEELEVLVFLELASGLSVDHPVLVLSTVEFGLATPRHGIGPCLTASPVANEIFVARVHENLQAALQDTLDLGSQVG